MKVELFSGNILLEMIPLPNKIGNIHILQTVEWDRHKGRVSKTSKKSKFKPKDLVRITPRSGVVLDGGRYCLIKEKDIAITFKKKKMEVHGDNILVEPIYDPTEKGGLVVSTDAFKGKPQKGKVIGVGDDPKILKFSIGDILVFPKGSGIEMKIEDKELLFLHNNEILAKL
jgi:co-chaperonin GroES (HSP10)